MILIATIIIIISVPIMFLFHTISTTPTKQSLELMRQVDWMPHDRSDVNSPVTKIDETSDPFFDVFYLDNGIKCYAHKHTDFQLYPKCTKEPLYIERPHIGDIVHVKRTLMGNYQYKVQRRR